MAQRKRRQFSTEFKLEAVRLARVGDRNLTTVARDLDLSPSVLWGWVLESKQSGEPMAPGTITSDEREELVRLRRENKRLLIEREILKKAAAFFAKENG